MKTQTQYKALKNIGKKYVQRIFFSKVDGISLQVYHFNNNGTTLQAFCNEFAIFSSLWLLLEKTATQ